MSSRGPHPTPKVQPCPPSSPSRTSEAMETAELRILNPKPPTPLLPRHGCRLAWQEPLPLAWAIFRTWGLGVGGLGEGFKVMWRVTSQAQVRTPGARSRIALTILRCCHTGNLPARSQFLLGISRTRCWGCKGSTPARLLETAHPS